MSHQISVRADGRAEAMYALQPAWHDLGTVLDHVPNARQAFTAAGLDWEVETRPVFRKRDRRPGEDVYSEIPGRLETVRADTGETLGIVSNIYKVVQNWEAFQFVDKLVGTGDVRYESAGALKGGRLVWLLARLPDQHDFVADGDQLARYLLFYNSHDGSNSVTIVPTSVRVVCWNTISLADPTIKSEAAGDKEATEAVLSNKRKGGAIRISHIQNVKMRLDDAHQILRRSNATFDQFAEDARKLAAVRITNIQFERFLERLVPTPGTGEMPPARRKTRERITELYHHGPGQQMVKGTAWAALNAVTEFIDHDWKSRAKDDQTRKSNTLYSIWFGNAGGLKTEAHRAALELAAEAK